jgi:hypothetical protein
MRRFALFVLIFLQSCNHGLKPTEVELPPTAEKPGFGGIVFFKGTWPDTIYDLRVVSFRNYPPQGILNEVHAGKGKV